MKCSKCKANATVHINYGYNNYCDKHFLELIESRIKKDLRQNNPLNLKKEYVLLNDGTIKSKFIKHFLKNTFGKYLKLKEVKKISKEDEFSIIPKTLDEETEQFVNSYLENKNYSKTNVINPLRTILNSELLIISKILKLKYDLKETEGFVGKIEAKYQGTKFMTMKSLDFLTRK